MAAAMGFFLMTAAWIPSAAAPCTDGGPSFSQVTEEINQKNAVLDAPALNLAPYRYEYPENTNPSFSESDIRRVRGYVQSGVKQVISKRDAKKEVEWLFRLLQSQYGLYQFSGGDAAFEKAKREILEDLEDRGGIPIQEYEALLIGKLGFIRDQHLNIGNSTPTPVSTLYSNEQLSFFEEEGSWYRQGGPKEPILSVQGQKPEQVLKRAIGPDGAFIYRMYAVLPEARESVSYVIQYGSPSGTEEGRQGIREEVWLKPAQYSRGKQEKDLVSFQIEDGLPVLRMNVMFMDGDPRIKQVLESAEQIQGYCSAVIDLRNNPGGNGDLPGMWFQAYTGQKLLPNYSTLRRAASSEAWESLFWNRQEEKTMEALGLKKDGDAYLQYPGKQFLQKDGPTLFVLTSRKTASAAEQMTDALKNLKNTVTIGVNTGGVLTNAANYTMAMPYSGLRLQFGECLYYWDSGYFQEGVGLEPDIYLTGDKTDERLALFLKRYAPKGIRETENRDQGTTGASGVLQK